MCARERNSEFCFPESLNVSRDEVEESKERKITFTIIVFHDMTINRKFYSVTRHLQVQNSQNLLEKLNFSFSSLSIVYFFRQNARKSEFTNLQLLPPFCLFMYAAGRSGQQLLTVALGIHCIYLKPRDHESANHV